MIAISYQKEWTQLCSRSCCWLDSASSAFEMVEVDTLEQVADFFARCLRADDRAERALVLVPAIPYGEYRGLDAIQAGDDTDTLRALVQARLK